MSVTAKLSLTDFDPLTNGQAVFNIMSQVVDGMLHCKIRDDSVNDPLSLVPGPNAGEAFILSSGGAGAWLGKSADDIAIARDTVIATDDSTFNSASDWVFVTPIEGFILWMRTLSGHRLTFNTSFNTPVSVADTTGLPIADTLTEFIIFLNALRDHGVIKT